MGESNPSRRERTDSSKRPRFKYPYPPSIRFSLTDMSRGIAARYLGPDYKGEPEPLIPRISEKPEFEKHLRLVVRPGAPGYYSHPSMPGREYTKEDVDYLISLLIAAEKRILHFNGEVPGEMKVPLIERLKENKQFRSAVESADLSKELSIGLHELDIGKRAAQLSQMNPELGLEVVRGCAVEEVSLCSAIARQHVEGGMEDAPAEVGIGARLIDMIIKGEETPSTSIYSFAMDRLHEIRWLSEQAQKTGSVDQAFADFKAAKNVLGMLVMLGSNDSGIVYDVKEAYANARMANLKSEKSRLTAACIVAYELRLFEQHLSDCMESGLDKAEWEAQALADMHSAHKLVALYDEFMRTSTTSGKVQINEIGNPLVSRMMALIIEDPTQEIKGLELALHVIKEEKEKQKAEEERKKKERKFEIPVMYDHNLDQELEQVLPQDEDERSKLIRESARSLFFNVRAQVPFQLVQPVYRDAVAKLRGDYSPEGTVRIATNLVDMSMGNVPMKDDIYSNPPNRLEDEDFEAALELLKPARQELVRSHFTRTKPSHETLENYSILVGDSAAILRNNVLGAWTSSRQKTQRISGTYHNSNLMINSFDDAEVPEEHVKDTSKFEFEFDRPSGKVTLIKGWDNIHLRELDGMQVVPEMPSLVFPLPNLGINMELEDALNNSFPRELEGVESKRNVQIRMVARTVVLYAGLNSENEQAANGLAELIEKRTGTIVSSEVPGIYKDAVASIQEDHSITNIVSVAVALVNKYGEPIVTPTPAPAPTTPKSEEKPAKTNEEILSDLMIHEKELISKVVGVQECTADTIGQFLAIEAGAREFRMRNLISSMWTGGDFSKDIERLRSAKDSIYRTCAIDEPTEDQKRLAIADPSVLTDNQRALVATFSNVPISEVTREHIFTFGMWLRADRSELQTYWENNYPSIHEVTRLMMGLSMRKQTYSPEEGALIRRIRGKGEDEKLTPDDFKVETYAPYQQGLRALEKFWFGTPVSERADFWKAGMTNLLTAAELSHRVRYRGDLSIDDSEARLLSMAFGKEQSELSGDDVTALDGAFMNKTYSDDNDRKCYFPPLLRLARHGDAMKLRSLYFAAQRQSEFNTLAEFLGCSIPEPKTVIHTNNGMTVPKVKKGKYAKTNDDCFSSATVQTLAGELRFHGVFDGMGGHASGDVASNIARTVFEIHAVAGWLRSPEDIRKALILADIVIATEAISRKTMDDEIQEHQCNMGTTATITMQKGRELYVVHCGDSPAKVLRNGQTVHDTDEHNYAFELRAMGVTDFDPARIPNNIVVAALGAVTKYISINNGTNSTHTPIILEDGDIIMVASDGISDVVDDSEIHYLISACQGDLDEVRRQLIALAESRDGAGPFRCIIPDYPLEVAGKGSDDKTIIMERVKGLRQ